VKIRVIRRIGRRLWVVIKHQSTSMNRNLASRVWCSFNARWGRRRKLTGQRSCEQYQLYRVDGVGLMVFQGERINLINMQRKRSRGCQKRASESQPRTMSSASIGDLGVDILGRLDDGPASVLKEAVDGTGEDIGQSQAGLAVVEVGLIACTTVWT